MFSHPFPIHSAAWVWVFLPQTDCAEVSAFAGQSSYVGSVKKTKKPKTTTRNKQTKKPPTIFPVLELCSELNFQFKGSQFLPFSPTSGNIHPVTEVWAHSTICSL